MPCAIHWTLITVVSRFFWIKKIFIGHEEDKPTKVHAIFDIPHTNAMREYMDNPEAKKMAQESGIKFETLFGVTCKD